MGDDGGGCGGLCYWLTKFFPAMRKTYVKVAKKRPNNEKDNIKYKVIENVAVTAPNWVISKLLTLMWDDVLKE